MKNNIKLTLIISLVLIVISALFIINSSIIEYNEYELSNTSKLLGVIEHNTIKFSSFTTKLTIALLRLNDYTETGQQALTSEIRLAILDNINNKQDLEYLDVTWQVELIKFFKEELDKLYGNDIIDYEKNLLLFRRINEAYLLIKLREFPLAIEVYTDVERDVADQENLVIPLLIFRAFSHFMNGDSQSALEDLYNAKDFKNRDYMPSIIYLLNKILGIVEIRNSRLDLSTEEKVLETGITLFKTFEYEKSRVFLLDYLRDPTNPNREASLYYLGRIEEELGNFDLAIRIYELLKDEEGDEYNISSSVRLFIIKKHYLKYNNSEEELDYLMELGQDTLVSSLSTDYLYTPDDQLIEDRQSIADALVNNELYIEYFKEKPKPHVTVIVPSIVEEEEPTMIIVSQEPPKVLEEPTIIIIPQLELQEEIPTIIIDPEDTPQDIQILLEEKKREIQIVTRELDKVKQEWGIRNTSSYVGYVGSAVSTGVFAYNGYQLYQFNSLISQGIDPSTVQGMTSDAGGLTEGTLISGGIGASLLLISVSLNLFDYFNDTEDNIQELEQLITLLEEERYELEHEGRIED